MALDITGIGEVAASAQKILSMIFPDKTAEEQNKLAAALSLLNAQTTVDNTEAASTDPLQHWRGGLGWVCTGGYFYNFILQPAVRDVCAVTGKTITLVPLDIGTLATLTMGMLGLGAAHVVGQINGVK